MIARRRLRLTYANVAATLALVFSIAGGGTALALVVTGAQVKDGSLTGLDVKNDSLASADVKAGSIVSSDINPATRSSFVQAQPWDPIPSGMTVTGNIGFDAASSVSTDFQIYVPLPGLAASGLTSGNVNFSVDDTAATTDDDATCTGSAVAPTAPAGKVCLYLTGSTTDVQLLHGSAAYLSRHGFMVGWVDTAVNNADTYVFGTWAYHQP